MAQNFPSNPTLNTTYTVNNESWTYDGSGWARAIAATGSGILPSVSGNTGRYLTTDGSTISWGAVTSSSVTVSDTAPASPTNGNIWFDSTKLNTYVYYNDGDSSQWVNATSVSVGTILPPQTGNSGKYLTTNGSTASWGTVSISANSTLTNPTITNYTETRYSATVTSNAITLDLTNGTFQTITTMVGANAITLPAVASGKSLTVQILYASTPTSLTFATPSGSLKWPNSLTPTPTLTNSKYDFYSFISDGTNWYGSQGGVNF
jgi:hypothetical protein